MTTTALEAPSQRTLLLRAFAYYAALVMLGLTVAAFGPTLPGLAAQTSSTFEQISIIFTVNSLGYAIGSLLGGVLYGRLPGQVVICGALLIMSVMIALIPIAPSLLLLIITLIVLGVGMGTLDVGGNTLIVWMFGDKVGPYMNALHFSFGLGAFLSPIIVDRVIVSTGGIKWVYWFLALLIIPVVVWLSRLPSPTDSGEQEKQARESSVAGGLSLALILMAAGLLLLHVGGELGFAGFIFSYGDSVGLTETSSRLLNSSFWGALALGRLVSIPLAMRLLPKMMLFLAYIGAILSILIVMLAPGAEIALWVGTFGFGFSMGPVYASVINFAERRVAMTSTVTSILLVGGSVGSMIIPWLVGQVFASNGPNAMMLLVGATVVASIVLLGFTQGFERTDAVSAAEAL